MASTPAAPSKLQAARKNSQIGTSKRYTHLARMANTPSADTKKSPLRTLALVIIPLVGGTVAFFGGPEEAWIRITQAPVTAFLLWIVVKFVLFAVSLGKEVAGNIRPRLVNVLTEGALAFSDSAWARLRITFSGFRRRYLKHVIYEHRYVNARGLRTQGAFRIRLEKVFVELRIAPNSAHRANVDMLSGSVFSGNKPIWDFLQVLVRQEAAALAILGAPGCGKTTLIQSIALVLAENRQRKYHLRSRVPVVLFLRDHVVTITSDTPPSLGALAQDVFTKQKPPPGWFERNLEKGGCLVLLDGLDEVADDKARLNVSTWVDAQILAYPRSPFVLTARPLGYRTAPLQSANVLEVRPFTAEQVKNFIQSWYLANETMRAGDKEDEGVRREATKQANDLMQRLNSRPALGELTRNPLMLTMIAIVHSNRSALPGGRADLYAEICDVLLGYWRAAKGISDLLTAAQLRVVLEPLAAHMMMKRVRELRASEVLAIIEEPLGRVGVTGEGVKSFLPALQAVSGLLLERENDHWSFAHLTFQEYLAAAHFRGQNTELEWTILIRDVWWHEALRLYAAQGDATALIRAGLAADDVPSLMLVSECLEEAREIDPYVRADAEGRLSADLEAGDLERQRLAAKVLLARRMHTLNYIDENREVDPDYITCVEYQIFIDEQRAQGSSFAPDHWTQPRFPEGQAQAPICGVRLDDAKSFARWLTERNGSGYIWRLPTPAELRAHPSTTNRTMASWYYADDAQGQIGLKSDETEKILVQLRALDSQGVPQISLLDLARDLTFSQPGDALTSAFMRGVNHDINLDRNISGGHDFIIDLDLDRDLDIGRDLDLGLSLNLAKAITLSLEITIVQANESGSPLSDVMLTTLTGDRQHARALVEDLGGARAVFREFISGPEDEAKLTALLASARQHAEKLLESALIGALLHQPRTRSLLYTLVGQISTGSSMSWRPQGRPSAPLITALIWLGLQNDKRPVSSWYQRWFSTPPKDKSPNIELLPSVVALHWWLLLTLARKKGQMPAWEGIRLVRVRTPIFPA